MARRRLRLPPLKNEGADLVVTVDCGASGGAAFAAAQRWAWMWWCWIITGSRRGPMRWRMSIPTNPAIHRGLAICVPRA